MQCAAGNCHGSPTNSLRLACSTSFLDIDVVARWDYFAATQYVSAKMSDLASSEILRRPVDPPVGGSYHEGGAVFTSQSDAGYVALLNWVNEHGPSTTVPRGGFDFFAKRVQPMLVKRLHGARVPLVGHVHDYRSPGSGGNFSTGTTLVNYELTRAQIAMESPDPNASRLIAKNLLRSDQVPIDQAGAARGILHRGGALLDDFPSKDIPSPALCTDTAAIETGNLDDSHAYCVIARWIKIEQDAAKLAPLSGVVYVSEPGHAPICPRTTRPTRARPTCASRLCRDGRVDRRHHAGRRRLQKFARRVRRVVGVDGRPPSVGLVERGPRRVRRSKRAKRTIRHLDGQRRRYRVRQG
jgi:hypothetical protein